MTKTLICVGGPWHGRAIAVDGQIVAVPLPDAQIVQNLDAGNPYERLTIRGGMYKRETITLDSGTGLQVRFEMLAYYGTDEGHRPKGFHL